MTASAERERILTLLGAKRDEIAERFGVRALYVFGSLARGTAREASDVDLLVEFDGPATFDAFMGLKLYLEDHLQRSVDLVTRRALRPRLREPIEREALRVA